MALLHRFYFHARPIVPRPLRLIIRGWLARRSLRRLRHIWPILPGSERPPTGWQGWPEAKDFAFVLTHDVEDVSGLEKCRQLAELELSLGFRSCFNFIPEGPYAVAPELRAWLENSGFEIGVHDLHHDGKLYWDRREFSEKSERINRYLHEWRAVGFRSGFMHRNLDWIHDLDLEYDASTFDTDPFEPQPDGAETIFPFNIEPDRSAGGRKGYVELPYTLPQDSTLFLIFRERSTEIWRKKLAWIVAQRGMALLNVHPDYVQFDGESPSSTTFPVELYREFLIHVRDQFAGRYWHALPREVARMTRAAGVRRGGRMPASTTSIQPC